MSLTRLGVSILTAGIVLVVSVCFVANTVGCFVNMLMRLTFSGVGPCFFVLLARLEVELSHSIVSFSGICLFF